jgi:hypothetical protein
VLPGREILAPRNGREAVASAGPVFEVRNFGERRWFNSVVRTTSVTLYDQAAASVVFVVEDPWADNPRPVEPYGKGGLVTHDVPHTPRRPTTSTSLMTMNVLGVEVRRTGGHQPNHLLYDGKSRLTAAVTEASDGSLPRRPHRLHARRIVERIASDSIGCLIEVFS